MNGETRWLAFKFIAARDATRAVSVRWTGSHRRRHGAQARRGDAARAIPGLVAILTPAGEVASVNNELIATAGSRGGMQHWGTTEPCIRTICPSGGALMHRCRRAAAIRLRGSVHPEDRDSIAASRRLALETPAGPDDGIPLDRTDGEVSWVRERKHAFAGADGKPVRMLAAMFDITERKRAEDELRDERRALSRPDRALVDWYWRQDEHPARFTYSTAATDPPVGYPGGSAIGKTRGSFPASLPLSSSWAEHRRLACGACRSATSSIPGRPTDGTMRYVSTSGTPIFDASASSRLPRRRAHITERKRVEKELRSRQEMLEVAQKAARPPRRVATGEGEARPPTSKRCMEFQQARTTGHTSRGRSWSTRTTGKRVEAAIKAAQQTGDVDAEYRVLHPGGAIRGSTRRAGCSSIRRANPRASSGSCSTSPIAILPTQELQQLERQLRQAQRLEALGTLAGGIAHDFNNLLGAILGYGEMALRNVRAGSRLRRDIENIMIAGERGHALVERILAFSRSGVGERVLVHVETVVRETLALFAAKLPRHIVIERRLHSGGAAVMGDPTQIHQVLMNLLSNAVQAMPSGGTLRVSLDRINLQAPRVVTTGSIAAQEYVVMDVSDSGGGIPAEIFERIFDPFFTTKEVGVGTGLGLSLVHGIVTGLGGAIDVATTVGKGSAFKVYLPLAGDVAVPSKPRKRPERKTARDGTRPGHGHRRRRGVGEACYGHADGIGILGGRLHLQHEGHRSVPGRSRTVRCGRHRREHARRVGLRAHSQDASAQANDTHPARERISQRGGHRARPRSRRDRGSEEAVVCTPAPDSGRARVTDEQTVGSRVTDAARDSRHALVSPVTQPIDRIPRGTSCVAST